MKHQWTSAWTKPFFLYNRQAEALVYAQNTPQIPALAYVRQQTQSLAQDMQQSYAANHALQKGLITVFEHTTECSAVVTFTVTLRLTCHRHR